MYKKFPRIFALISVPVVLFVTACFGGGKPAGAYVTVNTTKSSTGLIPGQVSELSAYKIVDMLFSGLVYVDKDGKLENEVAKSIETPDNRVWTITLRDDFKFANGEKVTAKSFVDSWNFVAKISNAQANRDFLENVEGFTEKGDSDLSGFKVLGDYKLSITLKHPNRDFLAKLTHPAFWPIPSSASKDIKAFGLKPIGNGPYILENYSPSVEAVLKKNPDYKGPRQAQNSGLKFKIYAQPDAAYADVFADTADVTDIIPDSAQEKFKSDFPSSNWAREPSAYTMYFAIPGYVPHFGYDKEGLLRRHALSLAINRKDIIDKIYFGGKTPAKEFTAPTIVGYKEGLKGSDVLEYNPERAKKLWSEANAIKPYNAPSLQLNFATDRGDKALFEALAISIKNVLGINVQAYPNPDWKTNLLHGQKTKQPFRMSWSADWPAIDTYLATIFRSGSSNNYFDFSNSEYDALLIKAAKATKAEEAQGYYNRLQEILFEYLPVVPLFYNQSELVWSKKVKNVKSNWMGIPIYYLITKG